MPRALSRLLIALLLVLAIPLQGLASSAAGLCMAMGQHHGEHAGTGMDHGAAPGHHADDGHYAAGHSAPDAEKSEGKAHCPPCASCCAAAVIAPAVLLAQPDASPSGAIQAGQYFVSGTLPATLDRPPLPL